MSLKEKYELVNNKYPNHVVLVKSGNFWVTYKEDTIICKYVFGYELKNKRISFPNSVLTKNVSKLRNLNISYILVYELDNIVLVDNTNNSYTFYFNKYIEVYKLEIKYNKLISLIDSKVDCNSKYVIFKRSYLLCIL